MVAEQWREVAGFEGIYSISDLGRVRRETTNRNTVKGKILKPWGINGYELVGLWKAGQQTKILIHRLVAVAFLFKPANTTEVHHKNGIRNDNRAENLEWVSHRRNAEYGVLMGAFSRKLCKSDVLAIQSLRTARPLVGIKAVGRRYGVSHVHVMNIWRNDKYAELLV